MWPPPAQEKYKKLLEQAEVKIVSSGSYAPWKMQTRNEWMIDQALSEKHLVLALWNGSPGGTANCVKYAIHQKAKMINVWKYWEIL